MSTGQQGPTSGSSVADSATSATSAAPVVPTSSVVEETAEAARRVLVVDDEAAHRLLAAEVLQEAGYAVHTAGDGLAALRVVAQDTPGVILLDARMPVMDAETFTRSYRALPPPHAPIVLISADIKVDALADQIEAAGVIQKPYGIDTLVDTVQQALTSTGTAGAAGAAADSP